MNVPIHLDCVFISLALHINCMRNKVMQNYISLISASTVMESVFRVMYLKDTVKKNIVVLVHTDPGKIPKTENLAVQDLRKR